MRAVHWIVTLLVTPAAAWAQAITTSSTATVADVTEASPPPTVDERMAELEAKLSDLQEGTIEMRNVLDVLARVKLTAYAQARFEWHGDAEDGVSDAGKPTNTTQFLLRRGRVKATWAYEIAELMVQLDATPKGVVLKDLEASFVEPWTGWAWKATVGQFKWPFGYEVLQSSEARTMPERSRVVRALFPGERDRGLRLQIHYEWLRLAAALVNGNGTEDSVYGASDANAFKDVVGRLGFELDHVVAGVSGYYGQGLSTKLGSGGAAPTTTEFTKSRLGADVQVYLETPHLGGLAIKGEVMGGTEASTTPFGFSGQLAQSVGTDLTFYARADYYDPDLDAADDGIVTVGGGARYFFNGYLNLSLTYEHPISLGVDDPSDDTLTAQLQASFQ